MGQQYAKTFKVVQDNAATLRDLTWLTYDGLIKAVEELNIILDDLTKSEGNDFQLLFAVSSTDDSYLWKAFVRITCCKIKKSTNKIETEKCLDLARFCKVYRELRNRYSKRSEAGDKEGNVDLTGEDFTISVILSSFDAVQTQPIEECCICMERHSDVSLGCAHSYCKECIHQWFDDHNTCPICRKKVEGQDEFWVLANKPTESEMADYVMGFTDKDKCS